MLPLGLSPSLCSPQWEPPTRQAESSPSCLHWSCSEQREPRSPYPPSPAQMPETEPVQSQHEMGRACESEHLDVLKLAQVLARERLAPGLVQSAPGQPTYSTNPPLLQASVLASAVGPQQELLLVPWMGSSDALGRHHAGRQGRTLAPLRLPVPVPVPVLALALAQVQEWEQEQEQVRGRNVLLTDAHLVAHVPCACARLPELGLPQVLLQLELPRNQTGLPAQQVQ